MQTARAAIACTTLQWNIYKIPGCKTFSSILVNKLSIAISSKLTCNRKAELLPRQLLLQVIEVHMAVSIPQSLLTEGLI
jgi:hypothetical protein